jgi:nucleoside-diphosphate-sugar epimerase
MYINGINSPLGKSLIKFFQSDYKVNNHFNYNYAIFNGFKSPANTFENNIYLYNYNVNRLSDEIKKLNWLGLKKIIFISAISVYGNNWDGLSTNASPNHLDFYSLSKLECENILSKLCKEKNVTFHAIRVPGICEPFCNRNFICKLITKIKNGETPEISSPNNYFNNLTCHMDICNLVKMIIEDKIFSNVINLGSTDTKQILDIVKLICDHYGQNFEFKITNPTTERIINIKPLTESGVILNSVVSTITRCLI